MMSTSKRPHSLQDVVWAAMSGDDIDSALREFLDVFYMTADAVGRTKMIVDEPPQIESTKDAYLAAVAEHLAVLYNLPVPDWVKKPGRFLHEPFFPCGLESLKAILLVESPASFRRRMIFVGGNPLYRPRKDSRSYSPIVSPKPWRDDSFL